MYSRNKQELCNLKFFIKFQYHLNCMGKKETVTQEYFPPIIPILVNNSFTWYYYKSIIIIMNSLFNFFIRKLNIFTFFLFYYNNDGRHKYAIILIIRNFEKNMLLSIPAIQSSVKKIQNFEINFFAFYKRASTLQSHQKTILFSENFSLIEVEMTMDSMNFFIIFHKFYLDCIQKKSLLESKISLGIFLQVKRLLK